MLVHYGKNWPSTNIYWGRFRTSASYAGWACSVCSLYSLKFFSGFSAFTFVKTLDLLRGGIWSSASSISYNPRQTIMKHSFVKQILTTLCLQSTLRASWFWRKWSWWHSKTWTFNIKGRGGKRRVSIHFLVQHRPNLKMAANKLFVYFYANQIISYSLKQNFRWILHVLTRLVRLIVIKIKA